MAIRDSLSLDAQSLRDISAWYQANDVPAALRTIDPRILAHVRTVVKGDWSRVYIDTDGSVMVANNATWTRT